MLESLSDEDCEMILKNHILKHGPIQTVRVSSRHPKRGGRQWSAMRYQITIDKAGNLNNQPLEKGRFVVKRNSVVEAELDEGDLVVKENRLIFQPVGTLRTESFKDLLHRLKFNKLKAFL